MSPITGLSLYDSLSKLIVGMLLLLLIIPQPACFQAEIWSNPLFYIAAFIVGAIYHLAIQKLTKFLRNSMCMIKKVQKDFHASIGSINKVSDNTTNTIEMCEIQSKKDYYKAYYTVVKKNMLTNVPVLEAHESFYRNIILIEILYLTALLAGCPKIIDYLSFLGNKCAVAVSFIIIIIGTCIIWCNTQKNIYRLVIEGFYYNSLIEDDTVSQTSEKK